MTRTTRQPRVLVLNHFALPRSQGGGTRHVELFGRLSGWSWLVIAGDRNNYTRERFADRSDTFRTVATSAYSSNGAARVLNWVSYVLGALGVGARQRGVDVVYASTPHLLTPVAGWMLAKLHGAGFVLEVRDLWPRSMVELGHLRAGSPLHRVLTGLEGFLYRAADRIVVVTAGWERHFASFGISPDKLVVVSNGADPDDFVPTVSRDEARSALGVEGFVACYAGAHGPANGLDAVLDAARELPEVTFLLVGDGLDKGRLVARARDERLDNVRFHAPVPKHALADLFVAADLGLHTLADAELFREGMSPNKLYDYLAFGLPAVTNAGGEAERVLEEADAGFGCGPDSASVGGFVAAVAKLAGLPADERAEMGRRGRAYVRAHKSRQAMAGRLRRALEQHRRPPSRRERRFHDLSGPDPSGQGKGR